MKYFRTTLLMAISLCTSIPEKALMSIVRLCADERIQVLFYGSAAVIFCDTAVKVIFMSGLRRLLRFLNPPIHQNSRSAPVTLIDLFTPLIIFIAL